MFWVFQHRIRQTDEMHCNSVQVVSKECPEGVQQVVYKFETGYNKWLASVKQVYKCPISVKDVSSQCATSVWKVFTQASNKYLRCFQVVSTLCLTGVQTVCQICPDRVLIFVDRMFILCSLYTHLMCTLLSPYVHLMVPLGWHYSRYIGRMFT